MNRGYVMIIGVPTEIKVHEKRVGLVPNSVSELVRAGHNVLIQAGAGAGISASDADYAAVGAKIVPDAATVFADVDMIVNEPSSLSDLTSEAGTVLMLSFIQVSEPMLMSSHLALSTILGLDILENPGTDTTIVLVSLIVSTLFVSNSIFPV